MRAHPIHLLKENLKITKVIINVDGAARGNPGPAAIGAVIKDEGGNTVGRISRSIGVSTNNQAEYQAIIAALEKAINAGVKQVEVKSDSELVVEQINGRYKIKNTALRPPYQQVVRLIGKLESFDITGIPREQNAEADALANKALDRQRTHRIY
jgi:ribonuclease HI